MYGGYRDHLYGVSAALKEAQDRLTHWERIHGRSFAQEILDVRSAVAASLENLALNRASELYSRDLRAVSAADLALRRAAFDNVATLQSTQELSAVFDDVTRSVRDQHELLRTHMERYATIDEFSMRALTSIDWKQVAGAFSHVEEIARGTAQFSLAYERLQQELADSSANLRLSPYIEVRSAVELFAHTNVLSTFALDVQDGTDEEQKDQELGELRQSISTEGSGVLYEQLATRKSGLLPLWVGAKEALDSKNPDRIRHYCVSQRELLSKLIDELAPDDEIRKWTSDPRHYKDGRPTRRAKLLYISRGTQSLRCTQFLAMDIKVAFSIFDNLNKGTHEIQASFSADQVSDLTIRADNLLLLLLAIADEPIN